jgi:hypothetical protein
MTNPLLTSVLSFYAEQASKRGLLLEDMFDTPYEFRLYALFQTVKCLTETYDMTAEEAFDTVSGKDEYILLAGAVWDRLQEEFEERMASRVQ